MKTNTNKKKICTICNFRCNWDSDMRRHLETEKHKKLSNINANTQKTYFCVCNKSYSYMNSLYFHRKTCDIYNKNNKIEEPHPPTQDNNQSENNEICQEVSPAVAYVVPPENVTVVDKNVMDNILNELKEVKQFLSEQKNTPQNITINNNQQNNFNLTVFLNEHCKDALNMSEFINTLKIDTHNVEYTGVHGYVEGITKIFLDGLQQLDVYKRPIHCTDLKRETIYIKDEDKWEKDTEQKQKIKRTIGHVAKRNMQEVKIWKEENPNYDIMNTKEYELHIVIMQQSLGGGNQEKTDKNNEKIIKNISRYVTINKSEHKTKKLE